MCFLFMAGKRGFILGQEHGRKMQEARYFSNSNIFIITASALIQSFFPGRKRPSRHRAQWEPFGWILQQQCDIWIGSCPSVQGHHFHYVVNSLKKKPTCCQNPQMPPCSVLQSWWRLLSHSPNPNLSRLSVCLLCLYPITVQNTMLTLIVHRQEGGLYYSSVPRCDQIWKQ